jgi:hypothetical protein
MEILYAEALKLWSGISTPWTPTFYLSSWSTKSIYIAIRKSVA